MLALWISNKTNYSKLKVNSKSLFIFGFFSRIDLYTPDEFIYTVFVVTGLNVHHAYVSTVFICIYKYVPLSITKRTSQTQGTTQVRCFSYKLTIGLLVTGVRYVTRRIQTTSVLSERHVFL